MSAERADLQRIRARLSVQERNTQDVSVRVEEVAEQVAEIAATMATKDDIKALKDELTAQMATKEDVQSILEQFKLVFGLLADQKADITDVRNLVASIIAREGQKPKE